MDHSLYRPAARVVLGTAILLMVPLIAMQLSDQVAWSGLDFIVAGALLATSGTLYQLLVRKAGNTIYRAAAALAVGTALFLIWANLAVGVIGNEDNPANLMYLGVLAVEFIGSIVARFEARGMARALYATAVAQAVVAFIALIGGLGPVVEIVWVNAMFVALFSASAALFRHAATRSSTGA